MILYINRYANDHDQIHHNMIQNAPSKDIQRKIKHQPVVVKAFSAQCETRAPWVEATAVWGAAPQRPESLGLGW